MKLCKALIGTMAILALSAAYGADEKAADAKPIEGLPANYPLKKCVISNEELGGMGKPYKVTHAGTDVYLCCKSCLKDFKKDPDKYVKMVKDAEKK